MTPKQRIDPLWVIGNSTLAQTLNIGLAPGLVGMLHDGMSWDLSSKENDVLWEALEHDEG